MTPLRRRMLEDMQLRNFASETQRNYIHHIKGLGQFYQTSPEQLDLEDIRDYQLHLLNERQQSPQTVNQFVSAAKFLYQVTLETVWPEKALPRVRVPDKLPVVLEPGRSGCLLPTGWNSTPPGRLDDGLWGRVACLGSGAGEGIRYRFGTQADPSRARQGKERPVRHAVAATARSDAGLVASRAAAGLAVSLLLSGPPHGCGHAAVGLPASGRAGRHRQAGEGPHAAAQLRHPSAG